MPGLRSCQIPNTKEAVGVYQKEKGPVTVTARAPVPLESSNSVPSRCFGFGDALGGMEEDDGGFLPDWSLAHAGQRYSRLGWGNPIGPDLKMGPASSRGSNPIKSYHT
jgi:hypothetical protein